MLGKWYCCAHLMLRSCVPAAQVDAAKMGMHELEAFPVLNPSSCTWKIMITMGLEHVQLMVKCHFLPLKEMKD